MLIQENNIEKEQIKGYHGREILELLQNADDAFQKMINDGKVAKCDLEVIIYYDEQNHILRVANTGTFFDRDGIKAIVQGNNSTKKGKYIGNKGTGFRSILNWAEEVKIISGDFCVGFSEKFAKELLEEYKEEQQIKKQLDKYPNLHFPMLAVPYNLGDYKEYDKNKTTIEVKVSSDKNQDDYNVVKQIQNIDMRILLFIPNISKIRININGSEILYQKQTKEKNKVVLKKFIDNHLETEESFGVFTRVIEKALKEDDIEKDIDLAIAIPDNSDNFQSQHLYSYFPLLYTQSPFNCLMHASYALGANRNTVDLSGKGIDLYKSIYNIIQQPTFKANFEASSNKDKFLAEGEMLVRYEGKLQFIYAREAILPSNTIINKKNLPIVEKGLRTNNENFVKVFGCKKYERTYVIDVENIKVSPADQKFQNYFNEFKKYVSAFGERNANIAKLGKFLSIKLATTIPVKEKDLTNFMEDEYSYINSSQTNWYVKVTGENFDVMRLANVIKDIYEHLANTPGFDAAKLRELFGREKKSDRELLIEDEFGTLDVIEEKSYADRIKENFFSRIRQFKNDYDCNTIDIDFSDFSENNFYNSQKIIEIFKQLNIDVKDFCDKNFDYPINLMPYFEKKVSDFIIDKRVNYKNFLYTQALNDETKQKTFLDDYEKFENYRLIAP